MAMTSETSGIVQVDDPLWPQFEEWLKHREVTPHTGEEARAWDAFRAGANAEHTRISGLFKDVSAKSENGQTCP